MWSCLRTAHIARRVTRGSRRPTVEVAVVAVSQELSEQILRPHRVVGVGIDVVVRELFRSRVVPKGTFVFNITVDYV